jgi:hypothetical protein
MDRHLNIFDFFNNHDYEFYEDNLSRGFALCLKYDTVLLDNVLRNILDAKVYAGLFNTDYPDYKINIDLQRKPTELENFSKVIAVACSAIEIDIAKIEGVEPRTTSSPETDLCLEINDTCIIFEFKRTGEDCSAQLKCQAELVKSNCPVDTEIVYVDFNWKKIVKVMLNVLSLQRQINSENQFTVDFVRFIEKRHADWFPNRLLQNISYPKNDEEPNNYYLNDRLNQLKSQVSKLIGAEVKEYSGKYYRLVLSVNWGWANEVHIDSYRGESENYISILIYPGDTKGQGWHLFKPNRQAIEWPTKINGFELENVPYIKFSHFNSGLFWYCPSKEEYEKTHYRDFFANTCGRYQKHQWTDLEKTLNDIAPNWIENCEYNQKIIDSNRTYFDLSFGVLLTLFIPYKKSQELDNDEIDSKFAKELSEIILEMKKLIDEQ